MFGKWAVGRASNLYAIAVAVSFLTSGAFVMLSGIGLPIDDNDDYAIINIDSESQRAMLSGSSIEIFHDYGAFVLAKASKPMRSQLERAFVVEEVRREVRFPKVTIDTSAGEPPISSELRARSDYYVVQFVGPVAQEWKDEVAQAGGTFPHEHTYWSENAFVIRASTSAVSSITRLPFVYWVGQYQPAYKLSGYFPVTGPTNVSINVFRGDDTKKVVSNLAALGASVMWVTDGASLRWDDMIVVNLDASLVDDVARMPEIETVSPWEAPHPCNDMATGVTGATLAWYKDTSGIDVPGNTWGGLTGHNQVVGVLDSGFDTGLATSGHYDWFRGPLGDRVLRVERTAMGGTSGTQDSDSSHGTHVSGSVGGNGWCAETYYNLNTSDHSYGGDHIFAGQAPECLLSFDACLDGDFDPSTIDDNYLPDVPNAWTKEYNDGARIHVNGWGGSMGSYLFGATADTFMWNKRDSLILFASGNSGSSASTICDGGTSKNDLTAGACGNYRPWYVLPSDAWQVLPYSSRGPNEGMHQPDVVAPGQNIASLHATNWYIPDEADYLFFDDPILFPYDLRIDQYPDTPNGQWDYVMFSGSSSDTAAAAGTVLLARQYYTEMKGIIPSGRLLKATMIHGGQDMGYGFPSNDQGWGRINVKDSLFPDAPATLKYHDNTTGITTGTTWNSTTSFGSTLKIKTGRTPLKVTLTWLDTSGNGGAIQNNMNLRVVGPDGLYLGNKFSGAWSVQGGSADTANLVERIIIQNPVPGDYWLEVVGANLPGGSIPFAIVVSGDFGPEEPYHVEMTALSPTKIECVAGGSATFNFNVLNYATNLDVIALNEENLPSGVSVTYLPSDSIGISPNNNRNITAQIMVNASVQVQTSNFNITATSTKDPELPPASDRIGLTLVVIDRASPPLTRCTSSPLSEESPTIMAYSDAGTDYLWVTFLKYDANGPHIYVRWSTDDGATWTERQVHTLADEPNDPRIVRLPATSPDHPNRILIFYHGWDPADETSGSWVRVCRADPPYNSWTNTLIMDNWGIGVMSNRLRRVSACVHNPGQASEELLCVAESIPDTGVINTYQQYSQTGGDTWAYSFSSAGETPVPGLSTSVNNFFPEVTSTVTGQTWMVWYISDGDRDVHYKRYNGAGAWQDAGYPMVTGLNVVGQQEYIPNLWCTNEGAGSNRVYVGCMRSSVSPPEAPFTTYTTYTDDPTAATPTWTTRQGSYSIDASKSDYSSGRPLVQGVRDGTGRSWFIWGEESNIYGTAQIQVAHSADGFATWSKYNVTASTLSKEHQTSAALGESVYTTFSAQYEGGSDIWIAKYNFTDDLRQDNPDSTTDSAGPCANNLFAIPNPTMGSPSVILSATIDDSDTGFHPIAAAEYWSDVDSTHRVLSPIDGTFNAVIESASASVSVDGWSKGEYTLYARGQDSLGNWGAVVSFNITVSAAVSPIFNGVASVTNTGTGSALEIAWDPADDILPVTYRLMAFDHDPTPVEITVATNTSGMMNAWVYDGPSLEFTHNGLTSGITYWYVCRARNNAGMWEWNTVVRNGTPELLVWFQAQQPFAGYRNLNGDPLDATIQTSATQEMNAVQNYRIDSGNGNWLSANYISSQQLDGLWKFRIYGQANNNNTHGYLYAVVKQYSTGMVLFTTGLDDEDIANYVGTYHQFYWEYNGSGILYPNDRYFVELWINATSTSAGMVTHQYTFNGVTAAGGPHDAYIRDQDDNTPAEITTPNDRVEATDSNYTSIVSSDDAYFGRTSAAGAGDEYSLETQYAVTETPSTITQIDITIEGRWTVAGTANMWAYNYSNASWGAIGATAAITANTDITIMRSITGDACQYYVNGNQFRAVIYSSGANTNAWIDFAQLWINSTTPGATFTFGYDNAATPSAIHPSLAPSAPPEEWWLKIPVNLGWNLISVPFVLNGTALPAALADRDGDTEWSHIQWYNPSTPSNKWRQYYAFWNSTMNDLTAFDNRIGIWLFVYNPGDGYLNLSGYNATATAVPLSQGWNLVGCPSARTNYTVGDMKAETGATIVEGYNASAQYKTSALSDSAVLSWGNGYWVYAPATTAWIVWW